MKVYIVYSSTDCDDDICPACDVPYAAFSSEEAAKHFMRNTPPPRTQDWDVEPLEVDTLKAWL